jgi:hypothetical protein
MTTESKTKERKARAQPKPPSSNGSRTSHKRDELAKEVATELKALRASLDEMVEHYRLRAGAQIDELLQAVEGKPALAERAAVPASALSQSMLEVLKEARLKPRKGRAKDFARMQELLEELVALLPPEN